MVRACAAPTLKPLIAEARRNAEFVATYRPPSSWVQQGKGNAYWRRGKEGLSRGVVSGAAAEGFHKVTVGESIKVGIIRYRIGAIEPGRACPHVKRSWIERSTWVYPRGTFMNTKTIAVFQQASTVLVAVSYTVPPHDVPDKATLESMTSYCAIES
jgi:hypothetical protein